MDQRRANPDPVSFHARLGGEVGHGLEGFDIFGPAIRVAGIIDGVHADEDIPAAAHLGHRQGIGQKDGVACRHIGDGHALRHGLQRAVLGHVDTVRQRRAADGPQVDLADPVRGQAHFRGHALRRVDLHPMPLAVVKGDAVTDEPFGGGPWRGSSCCRVRRKPG